MIDELKRVVSKWPETKRLRVVIEVDVPWAGFNRHEFNRQVTIAANSLSVMGRQEVVLLTTEEVTP